MAELVSCTCESDTTMRLCDPLSLGYLHILTDFEHSLAEQRMTFCSYKGCLRSMKTLSLSLCLYTCCPSKSLPWDEGHDDPHRVHVFSHNKKMLNPWKIFAFQDVVININVRCNIYESRRLGFYLVSVLLLILCWVLDLTWIPWSTQTISSSIMYCPISSPTPKQHFGVRSSNGIYRWWWNACGSRDCSDLSKQRYHRPL